MNIHKVNNILCDFFNGDSFTNIALTENKRKLLLGLEAFEYTTIMMTCCISKLSVTEIKDFKF